MDDGLVQAAGVVLDADGLFGFVEDQAADAVDLAYLAHGESGRLGWRRSVAIQNVKLCHGIDDTSAAMGDGLARLS